MFLFTCDRCGLRSELDELDEAQGLFQEHVVHAGPSFEVKIVNSDYEEE